MFKISADNKPPDLQVDNSTVSIYTDTTTQTKHCKTLFNISVFISNLFL